MMKKVYSAGILWLLMVEWVSVSVASDTGLRGGWKSNLNIYVESDDNVNRGTDYFQLDDTTAGVGLSVERDVPFSFNTAFIYSFDISHKSYSDWDKLSRSQYGLRLEYRFRPSRRFVAPVFSVYAQSYAADYNSALRSGNETSLGFSLSKRITDRTLFVFGLENYQRDADSDIFDIDRNRFYGLFDWRLGQSVSIYLQYQLLDGDIVTSLPQLTDGSGTPIGCHVDDAFMFAESYTIQTGGSYYGGGGSTTTVSTTTAACAYQLDADTTVTEIGLSIPFTASQSLQVALENYDSDAKGSLNYASYTLNDVSYSGTKVRLDYFARF